MKEVIIGSVCYTVDKKLCIIGDKFVKFGKKASIHKAKAIDKGQPKWVVIVEKQIRIIK